MVDCIFTAGPPWTCSVCGWTYARGKEPILSAQPPRRNCTSIFSEQPIAAGSGAELKRLLRRVGITATSSCNCDARAAIMDEEGPQWCRENMETIIDWMAEEAAKRSLPFVRLAAKLLVLKAIRAAERKARA